VPCYRDRRRRSGGFSLIETLVALVLAGLTLGAIAGVFGNGLLGAEASGSATAALSLAESKIAEASAADTLAAGEHGGTVGRYAWQLAISRYDDPQSARSDDASGWRLYRLAVTVAWRDGLRRRQVRLATLRLAAPPP